ncbi:MAG: hypothetical protein ACE5FB_03040 [Candidatus Binatia bacterium]
MLWWGVAGTRKARSGSAALDRRGEASSGAEELVCRGLEGQQWFGM